MYQLSFPLKTLHEGRGSGELSDLAPQATLDVAIELVLVVSIVSQGGIDLTEG